MTQSIQLDWNAAKELLPLLYEFYQQSKADESIDLGDAASRVAAAFGIDDLEEFAQDKIREGFAAGFKGQNHEELANVVAGICVPATKAIASYLQGNASADALIGSLNEIHLSSTNNMISALQKALDIPLPDASSAFMQQYSLQVVSVMCFAGAYKIYKNASKDAELAHQKRLEIERLCSESIEHLKRQRALMEDMVDAYLLNRLEPFNASMTAMDEAILGDDDDAFISASKELWCALGREAQYGTAQEFDDLMQADTAFRL